MNLKSMLRGVVTAAGRMLGVKQKAAPFSLMNLHPEVEAAFVAALKPVERREEESTFGTTSRGRGWHPRSRAYLPNEARLPQRFQLPKKSPFMSEVRLATGRVYLQRHGTLYRADRLAAA